MIAAPVSEWCTVTRALRKLGKSEREAMDSIIDWDHLEEIPVYYKKLIQVEKLFDEKDLPDK